MLGKSTEETELEITGPSRKAPLVGVLFILIAVAGYTFFTRPLSAEVSVVKADIVSKNERIEELKVDLEEFQQAEEEFEVSTEVQRYEVLKSIPVNVDQDEILRDLINIAEDNDIELKSLSFGKGGSSIEGIGSLQISSSFEGNYSDLIRFLEAIEENARVIRVNSINVQINKLAISEILRATFSLSMEAYFQQ